MKLKTIAMLALLLMIVQGVWADNAPVTYIERSWDNGQKKIVETEKTITDYTLIEGSGEWFGLGEAGKATYYVVKGNATYQTLNILAEKAHLILTDGSTLTLSGGVLLKEGRSLYIHGQSNDSGQLIATNNRSGAAGIGGDDEANAGYLVIHGGTITATGNDCAAGIGGGDSGAGGSVTIYGGMVTANAGAKAAGIGGGQNRGILGMVTIYGGTVNAYGNCDIFGADTRQKSGAGIGGGDDGDQGGAVNIYGGTVNAKSIGSSAAGIGGGRLRNGGEVNIYGGTVNATAGENAAGIGGGCGYLGEGNGGTVTISGGTVHVNGGEYAFAIGVGYCGESGGSATITGGTVFLTGHAGMIRIKLTLGDVCVYEGYSPNTFPAEPVTSSKRVYTCKNKMYVKIEACKHHFVRNTCTYCGYSFSEETSLWTDEGNYATEFSNVSGSTITITSEAELARLAYLVNSGTDNGSGKTYRLGKDLDMSAYKWTTIGNASNRFLGTLDGDGHTISWLQTPFDDQGYAALIRTNNGTVKNLVIANSDFYGSKYAAAIVCDNRGTVENCRVESSVIVQCTAKGDDTYSGGVVAAQQNQSKNNNYSESHAVIRGCYSAAQVTGNDRVGGIVGRLYSGTVEYNVSEATVSLTASSSRFAYTIGDQTGGTAQHNFYIADKESSNTADVRAYPVTLADDLQVYGFSITYGTNKNFDKSLLYFCTGAFDNIHYVSQFRMGSEWYAPKTQTLKGTPNFSGYTIFFTFDLTNEIDGYQEAKVENVNVNGETIKTYAGSNTYSFKVNGDAVISGTVTNGAFAWEGSGTSADPYLIKSSDDWKRLSIDVRNGNSYSGTYFEMTADIDAEGYSVGSESKPFSGIFSGGMHTLTYDRGGAMPDRFEYVDDFCAPFIKLEGATIRHLKVKGSIFSRHKFAAGIASLIDGSQTTTIDDCHVSSRLFGDSNLSSDATFGGLVAVVEGSCTASPVIKNCSFMGGFSGWATRSSGLVGYTNLPIAFKHCMMDPKETSFYEGCATFARMVAGVTCTFEECYYTQLMGEEQGVAVFREVLVSDGCTAEIISEPTIKFDGEKYWQNGAIVKLTAPDDVAFNHWETNGTCYINNPWQRNGTYVIGDLSRKPIFSPLDEMVKPSDEREMDGIKYRYLSRRDYHLYLSDEVCRQKGYQFDNNGDLFKWDAKGNKVWVTAIVGWVPGNIPAGGAVIYSDLTGAGRDHTLLGCIAPMAFQGCQELKTLFFKDTGANTKDASFPFDFTIGDYAFAYCGNLTEIKMMQYTTDGDNHWEALRPDQVSAIGSNVFYNSPQAKFSTDASQYQNYLSSATWKDYQRRITVYNHTDVDMTVNGARYSEMRNTAGESLKNDANGHAQLMETLKYWNADYQQFSANSLLTNSSENIWYTKVVGVDAGSLDKGTMRIYNDPGSYYNYKTIAIESLGRSTDVKYIEFWQTNGRSENSYSDLKLVIQNGAFAHCDSLKELRMYYYVQDGDDHWEVLGPKDVIPGDNIFGVHTDGEGFDLNTASFIPSDFTIVVSPQVYNDFINDPNWSKYKGLIKAEEYAPAKWDAVETEGVMYNYASKTANTASTDQVVTQNLSWWNVPLKVYEIVTLIYSLKDITKAAMVIQKRYKSYLEKLTTLQMAIAENQKTVDEGIKIGNLLVDGGGDDALFSQIVKKSPNEILQRASQSAKDLAKKGVLEYELNGVPVWTENAKTLLLENMELRKLLGQAALFFWEAGGTTDFNATLGPGVKAAWEKFIGSLFSRSVETTSYAAMMNGLNTGLSNAYAAFQAMGREMTEEEFLRGLAENIKANIHNVSYENGLIYTPDKKLIYHVYVEKPAKEQKKYTIFQDIGNVWNYRTVAISKNAFQGNKTLEEIEFAESPYIGRTNYVPMQLAIPDSAFAGCSNLKRFSLIYRTQLRSEARDENDYRGLGPENFILGGDHIFDGCDSTKLQIIIPEDRKEDFLRDENWSKYQKYFVYQTVQEYAMYTEYGVNYAIHYKNNTSWKQTRVNGHTIDHLTAVSADNEFLDRHEGNMGLFNDIGSYNNYKLDLVKRKAFAGNDHLRTVSFWDLNGGDSYTTLDVTLGDSCFINCRNLKDISMLYCVTDGTDHIEPLKPSQVRPGKGMLDGSPDCIIKMLPQQVAWFEADTAWVKYKERFRACVIQPGDEGVLKALKGYRYYTPCCSPTTWDGYIDLARIGGDNYKGMKAGLQDQKDNIRSFAEFKQFEVIGLDYVGQEWFRGCKNLSNILLPSTIKTIQPFAFANCYKLEEIELPAAVSEIGDEAFNDCPVLKIIHVRGTTPAKLTGKTQFSHVDGLRIYVPDAAVDAYRAAWPEYKDYIVTDRAYMLKKEVTVSKPNQLAEKLGLFVEISYSGLFFGDEPRYVHGPYAKYDSLTISGPLGNVDLAVIRYLAGCDAYTPGGKATDGQLRYLNLYNATIKKTDDGYHYFNDDLTFDGTRYDITTDNHLPDYLFTGCTALETVILPKSLKEIGTRIFAGCSSLKQLAVTGSIDDYESWTGKSGLLDYPLETLVFVTDKPAQSSRKDPWGQAIDNVYAKKSQIGEYMGQNYLTVQARNITAPIEDDAVVDALAEKGMFFPAEYLNMEKLGRTFTGNDKITRFEDFNLFRNIRILDNRAFFKCANLRVITIPDSVKVISRGAFDLCGSLDSIYISTDQVPELANNAFMSLPHGFRIFVPKQLCKLYREKWAQYADHINVDEDFYQKSPIKTVTVTAPNTLAVALGLQPDISAEGYILDKYLHGLKGDYSGITHLKVVGPISATDFDLLKHLAGYCPWKQWRNYTGHLEYLDLYDAQIVESDGYVYLAKYTTIGGLMSQEVDADVLSSFAFQNAYNLKTLILPRTCKKVRTRAMIGCEDLETLVIGDDMEDFNWDALDDGASLTRMYILAKKKPEIGAEFAVWRWLCNNYNPTFDAFYVRPSLYNDYIADDDYTGSSWQRTNNISKGDFSDDESFCAFAAHAAATKDDLAMVTSVDGWFDKHPSIKDLTLLGYTAIDSLSKATLAPLTELQQIAMPTTLTGMEEGLFNNARHLRAVDFLLCDSTDIVSTLRNGGFAKLGINTQQTLAYVPDTYGPTDETNVVVSNGGTLRTKTYRMVDTLDYMVPYTFETEQIENSRVMQKDAVPYTICVPYKLEVPAGARAYGLSQRTGSKLVFEEVHSELEAMKPYLLKVVGNKRLRLNSANLNTKLGQTIPANGSTTYGHQVDVPGYTLRGTFDAISNNEAAELGAYVLQADGNWHPVMTDTDAHQQAVIPPFRAYLLPSAHNAGARIGMELIDGDNTTDIDTIETIDADGTHRYYDLQGRELPGEPDKGIYIYKGKKVKR